MSVVARPVGQKPELLFLNPADTLSIKSRTFISALLLPDSSAAKPAQGGNTACSTYSGQNMFGSAAGDLCFY